MRHEFLDDHARKIKDFAQTFLTDHAVLIAVRYVFAQSHEGVAELMQQSKNTESLPQKIKNVFEFFDRVNKKPSSLPTADGWERVYSFSGQVLAVGSKVQSLRPGDMVAAWSTLQAGHPDLVCVSEYDTVLVQNKDMLPQTSVAGFALLAMHAIRRAKLEVGHFVTIGGFDAFGYILLQLAKLSGATPIVIDDSEERLQFARSHGAAYCFNSTHKEWVHDVLAVTQQHGVDVTIIGKSMTDGLDAQRTIATTRAHGRIVLVGVHDIYIDHAVLGRKDIDLAVAARYDVCPHDSNVYQQHNTIVPFVKWRQRHAMQKVVRLLENSDLSVACIASGGQTNKEHTPSYFSRDYGLVVAIQPMLTSSELTKKRSTKKKKLNHKRFMPAIRDSVRVGVIGADTFVQQVLMPTLVRMGDVSVNAVADVEFARAETISNLFGVAKTCLIDDCFFDEDTIDAVVVASHNMFHADRVVRALEHNKAVYVKEPLVTTFDQYEKLKNTVDTYANVPLCVDYHRSFAPFIKKIKRVVEKRSTPLMMRYRVNARTSQQCGQIEGASVGSIVNEACHFIDMFCFLVGALPVAVSVEAMHTMRDDVFPTDNFAAQISFDDGSVASLMYTTLGHEHFGGEHMELFFDSKVIVMQDFLTLTGHGLPSWFDEVVSVADTGKEYVINAFFNGLKDSTSAELMNTQRIMAVAHTTLVIDQLVCAGGGKRMVHSL